MSRIFQMLFGFVCSTTAISITVLALVPILNYGLVDDYVFRDFLDVRLFDSFMFVFVSSLMLAIMGLLPWAVIVYIAETRRRQKTSWFMLKGAAVAAAWILAGHALSFDSIFREVIYGDMAVPGTPEMAISIAVLAVACGALGGLVYWGIAGRDSGDWRTSK